MKKKLNFSGVTVVTWVRTIVLIIALINQVLAIFGKGKIDIAENDIYQLVSIIATIISTLVAWWKNNSFSLSAQAGDAVMKSLEGNIDYQLPVENAEHHHEVG